MDNKKKYLSLLLLTISIYLFASPMMVVGEIFTEFE